MNISNAFHLLKDYCENSNFKGWDPYDGLNSKVFQALPLKHWDVARLIWIQLFKRSPINLRRIFLVPKEHNPMGLALILLGYSKLYELVKNGDDQYGTEIQIREQITKLVQLLLEMRSQGYTGSCWGYNFDWQARRLFLFKKYTPTVVVTAFCVEALVEAYKITNDKSILNIIKSSAEFVVNDLTKTPRGSGFIFSYSVKPGNNTVINASLLGAKILSYAYKYSRDDKYLKLAKVAVQTACELQENDGSWIYGLLSIQSWKDSFHTGFNLDAIATYQACTGDFSFVKNLDKGTSFYLKNFFESDGKPKYYHNKIYPIDIHCPAQLVITLSKLNNFKSNHILCEKVITWTIENMQHRKGYFYYQLRKGISSKISYMRWSNAFMFNAMANYLFQVNMLGNEN